MIVHDYVTTGGKNVINDFLDGLPADESSEGYKIKDLLQEMGKAALEVLHTRQLRDKVWEIKFYKQNRFMYVIADADNFYILHACKKQKNKAEEKDLKVAYERAKRLGQELGKKFIK